MQAVDAAHGGWWMPCGGPITAGFSIRKAATTGSNSSHGGGSRDVLVEEIVAGFPRLLSSLIPSHHLAQALMTSSMLDIILIFQLGNLLTFFL